MAALYMLSLDMNRDETQYVAHDSINAQFILSGLGPHLVPLVISIARSLPAAGKDLHCHQLWRWLRPRLTQEELGARPTEWVHHCLQEPQHGGQNTQPYLHCDSLYK